MAKRKPKPKAVASTSAADSEPVYVVHDPEQFMLNTRPVDFPQYKLALGLDLGLRTGFAATYYDPARPFVLTEQSFWTGQLNLSIGNYESRAVSGIRLMQFLRKAQPDIVFFENVKHTPQMAPARLMASIIAQATSTAEFFGGLKMVVSQWAELSGKPAVQIEISDIKRRATNRGNANKEDIIRAFNALFSAHYDPLTYQQTGVDNMCDATFALLCGLETHGNGVI